MNKEQEMKNAHLKYNGFAEILKKKFGTKVYRVTLNAGLTCPNIDGTKGTGGCSYCNDDYLLAKSWHKQQPIPDQVTYGIQYIKERHGAKKFMAYFQNGTNTYANVSVLEKMFYKSIEHPDVLGLIIGTRADCLGKDVLDLLSELNKKTYLWIDLGLQSPCEETLKKTNRGHTVEEYSKAVKNLAERNILNCTHVILGMPDETPKQIIASVDFINNLPVDGIKIHNMLVTKHTELANWYEQGKYMPFSLEEYSTLCVDYLEHLRPDIIVHRLNAHAPARLTVAPEWSVNKLGTMNAIHKEIVKRDSWQGKKYEN